MQRKDLEVISAFGLRRNKTGPALKTEGKSLEAASFGGRHIVAAWKNGRVSIYKPKSELGKAVRSILSDMGVPVARQFSLAAKKKSKSKMEIPKTGKGLRAMADELAEGGKIAKLKSLARADSPIESEAGRKAMSLRAAMAKWEAEAKSKRGAKREEALRKVEVFGRFFTSAVNKYGRGG